MPSHPTQSHSGRQMAYSVLYHTPRSLLPSTCLVCTGVVGEQGSKQMIRMLTDLCGVEHGDCSSFPVSRALGVHFGHPPRLAEWSRGSVWLPTEGGNLSALVCRYCCNERHRLGVSITSDGATSCCCELLGAAMSREITVGKPEGKESLHHPHHQSPALSQWG